MVQALILALTLMMAYVVVHNIDDLPRAKFFKIIAAVFVLVVLAKIGEHY